MNSVEIKKAVLSIYDALKLSGYRIPIWGDVNVISTKLDSQGSGWLNIWYEESTIVRYPPGYSTPTDVSPTDIMSYLEIIVRKTGSNFYRCEDHKFVGTVYCKSHKKEFHIYTKVYKGQSK